MKKYIQWESIIIGKIDKHHPQSEEIDQTIDEAFTSVKSIINEISLFCCKKNH